MGREGKVHNSIPDIVTLFEAEVAGQASAAAASQASSSSAGPAAQGTALVDLGQGYDALWLAQQKVELKLGCVYQCEHRLWKLVSLDSQKIVLESATLFNPGTMEIATDACHKHIKMYKGLAPALLDSQAAADRMPATICVFEQKQASLFLVVLKAAAKLEPKALWQMVSFEISAKKLYSLQKLKAGDLTLVPATDAIVKVTDKMPGSGSKHAALQSEGQDYFVLPPKSFKAATDKTPASGSTSPFWYVETSDSPNMEFQQIEVSGCTIQCLTNTKVIEQHEVLSKPATSQIASKQSEPASKPASQKSEPAGKKSEPAGKKTQAAGKKSEPAGKKTQAAGKKSEPAQKKARK